MREHRGLLHQDLLVRISRRPSGSVLIHRITTGVACLAIVTVCVLLGLGRLQFVTGEEHEEHFGVHCGDSLAVITTLGRRTRPPPCLVVDAAGDPVPDFIIEGVDRSAVNSYRTDAHGRTSVMLGRSVRIRDVEFDMLGVSAITVVLRTQ